MKLLKTVWISGKLAVEFFLQMFSFFSVLWAPQGKCHLVPLFLILGWTVSFNICTNYNKMSVVNEQPTLCGGATLWHFHRTFWWLAVRLMAPRAFRDVLLSCMFVATLVSTSLHKHSFLWRPLEDFTMFIPCIHNSLFNSVYRDLGWGSTLIQQYIKEIQ